MTEEKRKSERALLGDYGMARRYGDADKAVQAARELVYYRALRGVAKVEQFLIEAGIPDSEISDLLVKAFKEVFYGDESETPEPARYEKTMDRALDIGKRERAIRRRLGK